MLNVSAEERKLIRQSRARKKSKQTCNNKSDWPLPRYRVLQHMLASPSYSTTDPALRDDRGPSIWLFLKG